MRHQQYVNSEQLRSSIVLQTNTPTRGLNGEVVDAWSDSVTIRARKAHRSSREFFAAHKVNSETTDLFIARYRAGVSTTMRIRFGSRFYNVIGANDPDDRKRELHLLAREVV